MVHHIEEGTLGDRQIEKFSPKCFYCGKYAKKAAKVFYPLPVEVGVDSVQVFKIVCDKCADLELGIDVSSL